MLAFLLALPGDIMTKTDWTIKEIDAIKTLYEVEGVLKSEIARRLRVTKHMVGRIIAKYGMKPLVIKAKLTRSDPKADTTISRKERIKVMWEGRKMSAQDIAKAEEITRNAVLGFVTRGRWVGGLARPEPKAVAVLKVVEAPPPIIELPPLHISMMDLEPIHSETKRTCRHPYGNGPVYTFCGNTTKVGKSYCDYHASKNFQPPHLQMKKTEAA